MKLRKKAQKLLSKLCNKAKQYLRDQLYYAKHSATLVLSGLKIGSIAVLFVVSVIAIMLSADLTHKKYLEHNIGNQVVRIKTMPDMEYQSGGTGFHMKSQRGNVVLVTNAHICEMANSQGLLEVEDKLNGRIVPKRVVEIYKDNDLCIMEPLNGYKGLSMADDLSVGEPVWAIGYPLLHALNIADGRVKDFGSIKIIEDQIPLDQCRGPRLSKEKIQSWFFILEVCMKSFKSVNTDVVIYGGNSGSPLVNMWGNVVGVVFAGNVRTNWGYAVPLHDLKNLLKAY